MAQKPLVVLIHGAWLGGYSWHKIVSALSRNGFPVLAPSLEMTAAAGLQAHVHQVWEAVEASGADSLVFIGHSYGAVVASEVAARCKGAEKKLVVLDGFIAEAGKSIFESYPEAEEIFSSLITAEQPDFIQVLPADMLGLSEGAEQDWLKAEMCPMPVKGFAEVALYGCSTMRDKYYIRFNQFPFFAATLDHAETIGWNTAEIDVPHMAILTHADAVIEKLLSII
ncbi:alpha/beta fold hydrolase [Kordiimonas pumila]|uniref:Alpha/beta fold hydrolase n=1 Tax=Kordiimonas pumila TaxID=2161677 RepID=A0ABV7D5G7_9PROT|nr:alpha/beta hydrolase [Kordiimonas pumila]